MDKKALLHQIQQLTQEERNDVLDALLDGAAFDESPPPVTEEQIREARARLEHHRLNPDEPTVTLAEIRRKLTQR